MTRPMVFISYSRKDELEKDQLLSHLGILPDIHVWSDDEIGAGQDWHQKIEQAMAEAELAILLVTANYLTSDFTLREEVPALLERRQREGMTVFPVIARACAWETVDWLSRINVRPKTGRPVWRAGGHYVDEELAAIAREVNQIVSKELPRTAPQSPDYPTDEATQGTSIEISGNVGGHVGIGQQITQLGDIRGQVFVESGRSRTQPADTNRPRVAKADLDELQRLFANLKALVDVEGLPDKKKATLERVTEFENAITATELDLDTMVYVNSWFSKNNPALAEAVIDVIVHPVVMKLVEAADEALASEYRRRFSLH